MTQNQQAAIVQSFKNFFKEKFVEKHKKNIIKLGNKNKFKTNPFLRSYLAKLFTGEVNDDSIARILIYPRALGSSPTTSFGQDVQNFISTEMKGAFGTMISGCDIEFYDHVDGRKKYAQLKSGPEALNKEDVTTVTNSFKAAKNLASTNNMKVYTDDFVFCLLYSNPNEWNANIRTVAKDYSVYSGKDFWHRLTGDENFMDRLIAGIEQVVDELNLTDIIEETVNELANSFSENNE